MLIKYILTKQKRTVIFITGLQHYLFANERTCQHYNGT